MELIDKIKITLKELEDFKSTKTEIQFQPHRMAELEGRISCLKLLLKSEEKDAARKV